MNSNNIGVVWMPYTIQTLAATWSGTPNLSSSITSKYYSTLIIESKNVKRKRKIENILKENHSD